ncbi:MAG: cytochrome P450 [Actinobacteria bacterium]|nr:MAG: cytochrome P450 [Actinomycetota bacterium]
MTGYWEVAAALADPRVSRGGGPRDGDLLTRLLTRMMLFTDPPDHTRLRALANRAFTPRRVEALRPRIAAVVDEQLAEVDEGEWDLIEGLAYPLPVIMIAEILSLPPADRGLFKRWSDDVIAVAAGVGDDPERRDRAHRSADALAEYFAALVAELRAHPNDTLLSGMVDAEEEGIRLTGEELLANAILLLMNGHETTTFAIGNGVLALLQHGAELARLRDDPMLISAAVEEILRYDGSVQMRGVSVGEDIEFEANQIRAGQTLWLAIGATGRDPRQFANPSCFDIARSPNRHLQFGVGPHFCIGAALARAEIQLALTGLLGRFRRIELAADDIKWHQIAVFRGPKAVPLALGR